MAPTSFPVISFQEFLSGTEFEKKAVAQKLYDAFHVYGWVYLENFGISPDEIDQMFAMVSLCDSFYVQLLLHFIYNSDVIYHS